MPSQKPTLNQADIKLLKKHLATKSDIESLHSRIDTLEANTTKLIAKPY